MKSGWRSVFMIFTAAANDDQEPSIESAFENIEMGSERPSLSFLQYFVKFQKFVKMSNTVEWCSYPGTLQSDCWRLLYGLCKLLNCICQ